MHVKRIQKFKTLAEDLQSLIFPGRKYLFLEKIGGWMEVFFLSIEFFLNSGIP